MTSIFRKTAVSAVLCVAFAAASAFAADEPAVIHNHPGHPMAADTEASKDPYKDCKPNPEKAAQMKEHPMPQTKGMQNMDPKLHEVDCPEPVVQEPDRLKHVHKPAGG